TADGGKTWTPVSRQASARWLSGSFAGPGNGVVVGERGLVGMLGGYRLIPDTSLNFGGRSVNSVQIDNAARGWLVGDGGLVRYSPAGASWQDPPQELPGQMAHHCNFRDVAMRDDQVWIVGNPGSVIYSSQDSGRTWQRAFTSNTVPLNAVSFASPEVGYAVGELGTVLKSEDAGQSWQSVSGSSRRLALLQLTQLPADLSCGLAARYGGHHGYRSGIIALCQRENSSSQAERVSESLRLQLAYDLSGGDLAEQNWSLPLDLPELQLNQQELLAHWNRAADGELSDVVLTSLVRSIRVYRPTVLVLDDPLPADQAGQLLKGAIENAIRLAGDPTAMVAMQDELDLKPWRVARVVERIRAGQGGDLVLDNSLYLGGLKQSIRMAVAPACRLLDVQPEQGPLFESFAVSSTTPLPPNLSLQDLFTGLVLGPGGDARRPHLPSDQEDRKGQEMARQGRNLSAYVRTQLNQDQSAAQMLAEIDGMLKGMSPEQAVTHLLELAAQYQSRQEWDYYEAILSKIIEEYPQTSVVPEVAKDLIQLWCSEELRFLRLAGRGAGAVRQVGFEEPAGSKDQLIPSPDQENSSLALPISPGSLREKGDWNATWDSRSIALYQYLKTQSPQTSLDPATSFAMASLFRRQGASRPANEILAPYLVEVQGAFARVENNWSRAAQFEFWQLSRDELPPEPYLVCVPAAQPPRLDAVLTEDCWLKAEEIRLETTVGDPELKRTIPADLPLVLLTYDRDYVYVGARIPRHKALPAELPRKTGREHDENLTGYDRLLISLDVNRDYTSAYEFVVDQRGRTQERCGTDSSWNPEWFVAAEGDENGWQIEAAIPRAALAAAGSPQQESVWSVSLTRILPAHGIQSWGGRTTQEFQPGTGGWVSLPAMDARP
ncbi:MAG: hypothetical protein KDA78_17400, partial [Planctomycetaceae bacterium]|nr:hypothetical protein [Planctomycetaceae bacterium]